MGERQRVFIVIGGGAAGFFAAVNAARMDPALKVILLEKTGKLLAKVRISGGGRCNLTHACFEIGEMAKRYPRGGQFVRKAFHRFFTVDTIRWFEERGVKVKKEADGRMFPVSDSSQSVIDSLLRESDKYGVEVRMHHQVEGISKPGGGEEFVLQLAGGRELMADAVCIACGGFPKASMFDWLRSLGHEIETPLPSLFTFNMPGDPIRNLMGVAVEDAIVRISGKKLEQRGPLLITHWGMSGPVILKLSAWGARILAGNESGEQSYRFTALVNWLPAFNENTLMEKFQFLRSEMAAQKMVNKNPFGLPARLWEHILAVAGVSHEIRWADLPAALRNKLVRMLTANEFAVNGKTTFKEEFVTAGGIRLNEVDPNTMMSRKVDGLYFAGEILDVDGITGGYNFQHAWTSGYIAAESVAGKA